MTNTQATPAIYAITIRQKRSALIFINMAVLLLLSILNIIKLLDRPSTFTYSDIIWFIGPVVVVLVLVDIFTNKTIFDVTSEALTITKKKLLNKKVQTYYLYQMVQIEVEGIEIRTFLPFWKKTTDDKVITFFYEGKLVTIGIDLVNFDAGKVADILIRTKNQFESV